MTVLLVLCGILFAFGAYTVVRAEIAWRNRPETPVGPRRGRELGGVLLMWVALLLALTAVGMKFVMGEAMHG